MEIKAHHCVCGSDRDRLASVTKKQNTKIAELEAEMSKYKERDLIKLDMDGNWYSTHVRAMTTEDLRSKSDIAAELGFRDKKIAELEDYIAELKKENKKLLFMIEQGLGWEDLRGGNMEDVK